MWFESYVKFNRPEFLDKVVSISKKIGISPDWLMFVMWNESALNPQAVNKYTGATGLIQFMPTTAKSLGTSTEALKRLSNVQQLDYVYKYFQPYTGRLHNLTDTYLAVFFPAAIGKPADWVFATSSLTPSIIASQNKIFDLNKDGKITVAEFDAYIQKKKSNLFLTP